jgi:hypothetical protein
MKFTSVSLFLILTIFSCKSQKEKEQEKLTKNLKVYFKNNFTDTTTIIDSFLLVKLDTLTQVHRLRQQIVTISNDFENLLDLYKLNTSKLSLQVSQLKLYGMLESQTLIDIQKDDVNKTAEKGKAIKTELDTLQKISENIQSQISTADTIKLIGFEARCFYQLKLKDNSVKRDTAYILLNQNKDIITRKDFLNLPYSISFSKFN